jgi:hypothetical protein
VPAFENALFDAGATQLSRVDEDKSDVNAIVDALRSFYDSSQ